MLLCVNDKCSWYETTWVVQRNPDNTVPVIKHGQHDKSYPTSAFRPGDEEQRTLDRIQRQLDAEVQPGAEVRKPR